TAPTAYVNSLSLHDSLPIFVPAQGGRHPRDLPVAIYKKLPGRHATQTRCRPNHNASKPVLRRVSAGNRTNDNVRPNRYLPPPCPDRKSTRLNSSHVKISYAV